MEFKEGDKVKIRKSSYFYGQSKKIGTITEVHIGGSLPYYVDFPGGYGNAYGKDDLEMVYSKWEDLLK